MNWKFTTLSILVTLISCSKSPNEMAQSKDPNELKSVIAATESKLKDLSCSFILEPQYVEGSTHAVAQRAMVIDCVPPKDFSTHFTIIDLLGTYAIAAENLVPLLSAESNKDTAELKAKGDVARKFYGLLSPELKFKDLGLRLDGYTIRLDQLGWPKIDLQGTFSNEEEYKTALNKAVRERDAAIEHLYKTDQNRYNEAMQVRSSICTETKAVLESPQATAQNSAVPQWIDVYKNEYCPSQQQQQQHQQQERR